MEIQAGTSRGIFRSLLQILLSFALLWTVAATGFPPSAQAKTSRAAIVSEVSGEVSVKKAGGLKTYAVYKNMSLNQGDVLITGQSAYVVLRTADRGDEVTIGENAEVYIAELSEQGGKSSKFKQWTGSLWSKVKSLVSGEDEFEVETPTVIMGVRGTQLFMAVDPLTGRTVMLTGTGIVQARTSGASANSGSPEASLNSVTVYPGMQIDLNSRTAAKPLKAKVEYMDSSRIAELASPKVLEAMLRNANDIQQENEQVLERLRNALEQGHSSPDDDSVLHIPDDATLNKVAGNYDAFLPNLAKAAVAGKKLDPRLIDEINEQISDPARKIDLHQVPDFDRSAGIDPAIRQLQNQVDTANPVDAENRLIRENQARLTSLLPRIEDDRKRLEEQNRLAEEEESGQAAVALLEQLSGEEKQRFEAAAKRNEQSRSGGATAPADLSGRPDSGSGGVTEAGSNSGPDDADVSDESDDWNDSEDSDDSEPNPTPNPTPNPNPTPEPTPNPEPNPHPNPEPNPHPNPEPNPEPTPNPEPNPHPNPTPEPNPAPVPGTTRPDAPVLVAPWKPLATLNPVVVKLKAPAGAKIRIDDGEQTLATAAGAGDAVVDMPLGELPEGTYRLTARTVHNGAQSEPTALPAITVVEPGEPRLISPAEPTAFAPGTIRIEAAAPVGSELVLVKDGAELVRTAGLGEQPAVLPLPDGVYSGLALYTEKQGLRGRKSVPVPDISVQSTAPAEPMLILFQPEAPENGQVKLQLDLIDFVGKHELYALQVHLSYGHGLQYTGPDKLQDEEGTVFDGENTCEMLSQIAGRTENMLIYTAIRIPSGSDDGNIAVEGRRKLVSIPLKVGESAADKEPVRLLYFQAVDRSGQTVFELGTALTIMVSAK